MLLRQVGGSAIVAVAVAEVGVVAGVVDIEVLFVLVLNYHIHQIIQAMDLICHFLLCFRQADLIPQMCMM
jgi:hypothetical protein